jgi:hypothetical protein
MDKLSHRIGLMIIVQNDASLLEHAKSADMLCHNSN